MISTLTESLNGGYNGLFGEVVTEDIYKIRSIGFIPDIIFDFGANVGVFSRFARELFPDALIIAVEPNLSNCEVFTQFTNDEKIILINKAIGKGYISHNLNAVNGAHECYLSAGLGYSKKGMEGRNGIDMEQATVETIMPDEIINTYLKEGMKSILKLDIEGGENIIWADKPSMDAIKKMDYIGAEIHFFALTQDQLQPVRDKTMAAIAELEKTHICELDNVNFWAKKRM